MAAAVMVESVVGTITIMTMMMAAAAVMATAAAVAALNAMDDENSSGGDDESFDEDDGNGGNGGSGSRQYDGIGNDGSGGGGSGDATDGSTIIRAKDGGRIIGKRRNLPGEGWPSTCRPREAAWDVVRLMS